jgi:hypothetical protein
MLKYKQKNKEYSTGLGYQLSLYTFMRDICSSLNLDYAIGTHDIKCVRNTFSNIQYDLIDDKKLLNEFRSDLDINHPDWNEYSSNMENYVEDDTLFSNDIYQRFFRHFNSYEWIINSYRFRSEVLDHCTAFINQFKGENLVSMHVRSHYENKKKFLIDIEYYHTALRLIPKDSIILLFCNSKDYLLNNTDLMELFPSRFVIITDVVNNNNFINCDVGQELDLLVDTDPTCCYDYNLALAKLASISLGRSNIDTKSLSKEMKRLANELHPTYRYKIKNNIYNYSIDLCLMSMCQQHIISNSLYSLWGSMLAKSNMTVYPKYWNQPGSQIVRDLGGINESCDFNFLYLKDERFVGLENPDKRSFIFNK